MLSIHEICYKGFNLIFPYNLTFSVVSLLLGFTAGLLLMRVL